MLSYVFMCSYVCATMSFYNELLHFNQFESLKASAFSLGCHTRKSRPPTSRPIGSASRCVSPSAFVYCVTVASTASHSPTPFIASCFCELTSCNRFPLTIRCEFVEWTAAQSRVRICENRTRKRSIHLQSAFISPESLSIFNLNAVVISSDRPQRSSPVIIPDDHLQQSHRRSSLAIIPSDRTSCD